MVYLLAGATLLLTLTVLAISLWLWLKPHPEATSPQAVVVLGGGVTVLQHSKGAVAANSYSVSRVQEAYRLARDHNLPLLISGAEAPYMQKALEDSFGAPKVRILLEDQSRTTCENARYSAQALRELGWSEVFLVSDRFHLPRASADFAEQGMRTQTHAAALPGRFPGKAAVVLYRIGYETAAMQRNLVLRLIKSTGRALAPCTAPRRRSISELAQVSAAAPDPKHNHSHSHDQDKSPESD